MAEAAIPVDLTNPGQVFACLGLIEAAEVLLGEAAGGFDWTAPGAPRFRLSAAGEDNPVAVVLDFLAGAGVTALAPAGAAVSTARWGVPSVPMQPPDVFPFPPGDGPDRLPVRFERHGQHLWIDHWGDGTGLDGMKFWAGSGGYPGAALARDAQALLPVEPRSIAGDPFAFAAPQSSSFRFDWRRDYIPIDAGFSPNAHGSVVMVGFPAVELLAAIGLAHARPARETKLAYRYGVPGIGGGAPLPPCLLRAALGAPDPFVAGVPLRRFRMLLGWPGQEGQARAITDVIEETAS